MPRVSCCTEQYVSSSGESYLVTKGKYTDGSGAWVIDDDRIVSEGIVTKGSSVLEATVNSSEGIVMKGPSVANETGTKDSVGVATKKPSVKLESTNSTLLVV